MSHRVSNAGTLCSSRLAYCYVRKLKTYCHTVTMLAYNKYGQDLELTHIRLAFVTAICIGAAILFFMKQAIDQSKEQQQVEFEVKAPGK